MSGERRSLRASCYKVKRDHAHTFFVSAIDERLVPHFLRLFL